MLFICRGGKGGWVGGIALSGCLFLPAPPTPNFSVSSFYITLPPCTILSRIVGCGVNSCWGLRSEVAAFAWILHGLFLLSNWALFFFFLNYSPLCGGEICKYVFVLPAFPEVSLVFRRRRVCGSRSSGSFFPVAVPQGLILLGMLWLLPAFSRLYKWRLPFLLCVSLATAGSKLQPNYGEGQRMLMGHLAVSVSAWLSVENKIELTEGENAILT